VSWRIPLLATIAIAACDYGDPQEYDAPPAPPPKDANCTNPTASAITIDSYPIFDPVTADVEVLGTLTDDPSIVTTIFLGAHPGARDVSATPGATWRAVVPLTLLLEPNQGPGSVSIHATAVTACHGNNDAAIEVTTVSKSFRVAFAPPPVDAGVDDAVGLR
jgi:hypothetical protein